MGAGVTEVVPMIGAGMTVCAATTEDGIFEYVVNADGVEITGYYGTDSTVR